MPFYKFMVQGWDPRGPREARGFYTTRHTFAETKEAAALKVLNRLSDEFTVGVSAKIWGGAPPAFEIQSEAQIGLLEALTRANTGSTFYDERE